MIETKCTRRLFGCQSCWVKGSSKLPLYRFNDQKETTVRQRTPYNVAISQTVMSTCFHEELDLCANFFQYQCCFTCLTLAARNSSSLTLRQSYVNKTMNSQQNLFSLKKYDSDLNTQKSKCDYHCSHDHSASSKHEYFHLENEYMCL